MANSIIPNPFLTFDASELKSKIIQKLNDSQVFTDQNYEGSNLSGLIDIISYSFGTLLFYLNRTSSESMFSEAQIYENMNRIVKLLNYNPIGKTSQTVPFYITAAAALAQNVYVIPRFSFLQINNLTFSLTQDLTFYKSTSSLETLSQTDNSYLLHEGTFEEYPLYKAMGVEDETLFLSPGSNIYVDHFNIHVYVRPKGARWEKWERVEDRSAYSAKDRIFEARLNPNKNYEIIFGDGINGTKLNRDDEVAVYYLRTTPNSPTLASGLLDTSTLVPFNTIQYETILRDTKNLYGSYITNEQYDFVKLFNPYPSTNYSPEESVDSIRKNAPKIFRSQKRLVTLLDYEAFANANFKNIIANAKVFNNEQFLSNHIKYLYNIGLSQPHLDNQVLYNQVKFGSSCNFNNIYVYTIPSQNSKYLLPSQKEYVQTEFNKYKNITSQVVLMDPEYLNFDFYVQIPGEVPSVEKLSSSKLRIFKDLNNKRSNASIKFDVINVIKSNFSKEILTLGKDINVLQLTTEILAVDGVKNVQTYRSDTNLSINEISFLVWNPKYPTNDIGVFTQTVFLEDFMAASLYSLNSLSDRIEIVDVGYGVNLPEF
jgi:hypothetical protein